jgi:hypothetical protein
MTRCSVSHLTETGDWCFRLLLRDVPSDSWPQEGSCSSDGVPEPANQADLAAGVPSGNQTCEEMMRSKRKASAVRHGAAPLWSQRALTSFEGVALHQRKSRRPGVEAADALAELRGPSIAYRCETWSMRRWLARSNVSLQVAEFACAVRRPLTSVKTLSRRVLLSDLPFPDPQLTE